MSEEIEAMKFELNEEQKAEQAANPSHRVWYPTPLFCHSKFFLELMDEGKIAHGKYGPKIAEHLPTGRPLMIFDNVGYEAGCFDSLPDRAMAEYGKTTMQAQINHLFDTYSPHGQPEAAKVLATRSKPDQTEVDYTKEEDAGQ